MNKNDGFDWNNLSFEDLEKIDFENIPSEHVAEVAKMMCLRSFHDTTNISNRALSKLTGTHYNTVTNKGKGKGMFSILEMMIMFAVRELPQEDVDDIANKGGNLNLSKLWDVFK